MRKHEKHASCDCWLEENKLVFYAVHAHIIYAHGS